MWEAIRANAIRSRLLVGLLGALLVLLGFLLGFAVDPGLGGPVGVLAALGLWFALWLAAVFQGDAIILSSVRARPVSREEAPQLWNVVEEMKIAAGLPAMPRIHVIDEDLPNAFAVGRTPDRAAIAVTTGLLRDLDRDELQGVVAHEIGHIVNQDIRFMTMASVMLGTVVILSDLFLRSVFYAGAGSRRSSKGGSQGQLAVLLVGILVAILAPALAQLLYFASSRRREYLADASAARFTRYPEGLASALEKISARAGTMGTMNRAMVPLLTVNPVQDMAVSGLFSTHPPTDRRIAILRGIGGQVGYAEYQASYRKVLKATEGLRELRTVRGGAAAAAPVRAPTAEADRKAEALGRARNVGIFLDRLGDLLPLACGCGLRIKLPQGVDRTSVECPRCGRTLAVPRAVEAAAPPGAPPPPLSYRRQGEGWETFRCPCGRSVSLSPALQAPSVRCPGCRREIRVEPSGVVPDLPHSGNTRPAAC